MAELGDSSCQVPTQRRNFRAYKDQDPAGRSQRQVHKRSAVRSRHMDDDSGVILALPFVTFQPLLRSIHPGLGASGPAANPL